MDTNCDERLVLARLKSSVEIIPTAKTIETQFSFHPPFFSLICTSVLPHNQDCFFLGPIHETLTTFTNHTAFPFFSILTILPPLLSFSLYPTQPSSVHHIILTDTASSSTHQTQPHGIYIRHNISSSICYRSIYVQHTTIHAHSAYT